MGSPKRIWAVSAINSDIDKLVSIHNDLFKQVKPGDRVVYTGNYTGYGLYATECIDEILTFRRLLLSQPGMKATDILYLRGIQEEIWEKLLQIQWAPDPTSVLLWMLGNGLANTLTSYDISQHDGIDACRRGVMGLTKWTNEIRSALRKHAGHETFYNQLLRAAHSSNHNDYPMLFVHAGLNVHKKLEEQNDDFWWAGDSFEHIKTPYDPFKKVIRGYDPRHGGVKTNCVTATIDGGCGFGGSLVCAGFERNGDIAEMLER